jgi:hypothetical protein
MNAIPGNLLNKYNNLVKLRKEKDSQYNQYLHSLIDTLQSLAEITDVQFRESTKYKFYLRSCKIYLNDEFNIAVRPLVNYYSVKLPYLDLSEILSKTLNEVFDKILNFSLPQNQNETKKLFKNWIIYNSIGCLRLKGKFKDEKRRVLKIQGLHQSLNQPISANEGTNLTLEDILKDPKEFSIEYQQIIELSRRLEDYILEDKDNRLKNCCSRSNEQCNGQQLTILKLLQYPPLKRGEIIIKLQITGNKPEGIVHYVWDKTLIELKKITLEIAEELGISPEELETFGYTL